MLYIYLGGGGLSIDIAGNTYLHISLQSMYCHKVSVDRRGLAFEKMESQWADLQGEILENICGHISSEDLLVSRLACKNWAKAGARALRHLRPSDWNLKFASKKYVHTTTLDLGRCSGSSTSSDIQGLACFKHLQSLSMPKWGCAGRKALDDDAMKVLGTLISLTSLDISGSWLECGLASLSRLTALKKLIICGCRWISSESELSVSIPKELCNLTHLDLSSSMLHVSDGDLEVIGTMMKMSTLSLADCQWVLDRGLSMLAGLPDLKVLDLTRTGLTDRGVLSIAQLPNLVWLRLEGTLISDVGTAMLAECISLEKLDLSGCYMVTEEGINKLNGIKRLREIVVQGVSYFSTRGVQQLSSFQNLETVSFDMPQWIADEEVGLLMNSTALKRISINGCKGTCILWMLSHPTLKEVTLTNGRLGVEHLQYLSTLESLDTLKISQCEHLALAAFEKLRCLRNLKNLSLDIAHGTFEKHFIAGSICPLFNLQELSLSCEYILDETVADLWRLPKLSSLFLEDCVYLTDVGFEFLAMIHELQILTLRSPLQSCTNDNLSEHMEVTEKGLFALTALTSLRKFVLIGRHSIGQKSWRVLNSASALREIAIAVPPQQTYTDDVKKSIRAGIRIKFHASCIRVMQ